MRIRSDFIAARASGGALMRLLHSRGPHRVLAFTMLAMGAAGASLVLLGPTATAETSATPAEVVATVYAAATAAGSFHYVNQQTLGINGTLVHQTESGDVSHGVGVQFINGRLGDSEAIVIGSVAYLKGDAAALQVDLLYPLSRAKHYANRWISFTSKDAPFQTIKDLVLNSTFWGNPAQAPLDSLPQRPSSISQLSRVDGRSVESVTSTIDDVVKSTSSSFVGHAQVYFAATSPQLPYRLTDATTGTEAGSPFSEQDSATFSKWREHFEVRAPKGPLRYSALPAPDAG
jgi:hypothetical protein